MKTENRIPSFARRIARPLRDSQKDLLDTILPAILINENFDWHISQKMTLEIGFGNGEFLASNAIQNPQHIHFGCEPYINGVASLLKVINEQKIQNIRLYTDDIRKLLPSIPEKTFETMFVICPDPWPKQKQKKRRLLQEAFIKEISTKTKKIVIATDHLDYAKWILKHINLCKIFGDFGTNIEDYTTLPENWIYTKYQRRGISNSSKIYYFELNTDK